MSNGISTNTCSTIWSGSAGADADYAHMHKLLVSLPPDPPPSLPPAILELKLACLLSKQWGPPHACPLLYKVAEKLRYRLTAFPALYPKAKRISFRVLCRGFKLDLKLSMPRVVHEVLPFSIAHCQANLDTFFKCNQVIESISGIIYF